MEKRLEAMKKMFYNFPDNEMNYYIRASIQRALLGRVSCNLRGVSCKWNKSRIDILSIYDGPINSDEEYLLEEALTEVMAVFPVLDVNWTWKRVDYPEPMNSHAFKVWMFLRNEGL